MTDPAPANPTAVAIAPGQPLTRAQWIAKGDAICAHLNAQLALMPVRTRRDIVRVLPQAAAYEHEEVVALAQLAPPATMAADWRRFLAETQAVAEDSIKLAEAGRQGANPVNLPLAATTKAVHEDLAAVARRDGFKQCSFV